MARWSPLQRSVTVGAAALQLSALLTALDANFPTRLGWLVIQYNPGSTGTNLYIGDSASVLATNCGANLLPGGSVAYTIPDTGIILTTDIWMLSTVAAQQVNIIAFPIGM
jgi:hypothetical protein